MPHNRTPPNRPGPSGPGQSYTPPGPRLWPHRNRPRDKLPRQTRKPTIYKLKLFSCIQPPLNGSFLFVL